MKYYFEVHTTKTDKPILLSFDKDLPMKYCYNALIEEIEYNTILTEQAIIDIFAEDVLSNKVVSLSRNNDCSIEEFIASNREFFPLKPVTKDLYKLFVIDKMYLTKTNENDDPQPTHAEIKTNILGNWNSVVKQTMSLIYL